MGEDRPAKEVARWLVLYVQRPAGDAQLAPTSGLRLCVRSRAMPLLQLPHTAGCLVCGRDNPHGLRLDLHVEPATGAVRVEFTPRQAMTKDATIYGMSLFNAGKEKLDAL